LFAIYDTYFKNSFFFRKIIYKKKKALWQNAKGLEISKLPGLMSESVLIWDKIKINMYRMKHGKLRISLLNFDIKNPLSI